ncbi:hypothetical protein H5410_014620 [Solanum commersonii]|uniref:Uncharacterized protein n=1 Tax=Solanum commersonii TaxID=4109 RepID=A0A9J5ZRY2_SOLCO|nr:hypothetical protein H5410_014620 [Solanum commersonii]
MLQQCLSWHMVKFEPETISRNTSNWDLKPPKKSLGFDLVDHGAAEQIRAGQEKVTTVESYKKILTLLNKYYNFSGTELL